MSGREATPTAERQADALAFLLSVLERHDTQHISIDGTTIDVHAALARDVSMALVEVQRADDPEAWLLVPALTAVLLGLSVLRIANGRPEEVFAEQGETYRIARVTSVIRIETQDALLECPVGAGRSLALAMLAAAVIAGDALGERIAIWDRAAVLPRGISS